MLKKPKQVKQPEQKPPEKTDPVTPPVMGQPLEFAINGADFKTKVLQQLVKHSAMPMLVMWWDDQLGWCSAVGNDLKYNPQVRKSVGINLFKIVAGLKIFDDVGIKAD
jgi:hypothetical protein